MSFSLPPPRAPVATSSFPLGETSFLDVDRLRSSPPHGCNQSRHEGRSLKHATPPRPRRLVSRAIGHHRTPICFFTSPGSPALAMPGADELVDCGCLVVLGFVDEGSRRRGHFLEFARYPSPFPAFLQHGPRLRYRPGKADSKPQVHVTMLLILPAAKPGRSVSSLTSRLRDEAENIDDVEGREVNSGGLHRLTMMSAVPASRQFSPACARKPVAFRLSSGRGVVDLIAMAFLGNLGP